MSLFFLSQFNTYYVTFFFYPLNNRVTCRKREDDDNDEQNYHCIETKNILKQNKRHETYIHTHTKNDDNKRQMYTKKRDGSTFSLWTVPF